MTANKETERSEEAVEGRTVSYVTYVFEVEGQKQRGMTMPERGQLT